MHNILYFKMEGRKGRIVESSKLDYSFINPFIAFATAKLDLAITCLDSFVTSDMA